MTNHPEQPQAWAEETQWLISAFRRHRDALDALPDLANRPLVKIPAIARRQTFLRPLDVWATPAEVHSLNLANAVNEFGQSIQKIDAWARIFETFTEDEQLHLVIEFINPLAVYALSLPFSLKNLFAFAAMRLSDEANRLCKNHLSQLTPTSDETQSPKWDKMWAYSTQWTKHLALKEATHDICQEQEKRTGPVNAYRDRFVHRIPLYIGLGMMECCVLQREKSMWTITNHNVAAVKLADIVAELTPQHDAAIRSHKALAELVTEQWECLSRNHSESPA